MSNTLDQAIAEAMRNAIANGFKEELSKMTDRELADDLYSYDAEVGEYPHSDIVEAVARYRANKAK